MNYQIRLFTMAMAFLACLSAAYGVCTGDNNFALGCASVAVALLWIVVLCPPDDHDMDLRFA